MFSAINSFFNPYNVIKSHKTLSTMALGVVGFALLKQSQYNSNSYAYTARCGVNTACKMLYSKVFQRSLKGLPEEKSGALIGTSFLEKALQKIAGSSAEVCMSAAFDQARFDSSNFPEQNDYFVCPVSVEGVLGKHITLLFIDKKTNCIEFYDSKALSIEHPKNSSAKTYVNQLKLLFPNSSFKELEYPIQFDGHNCGAYVCWFAEQRLSGNTFEQIQQMRAPNIEQYRSQLIQNR